MTDKRKKATNEVKEQMNPYMTTETETVFWDEERFEIVEGTI